VGSVVVFFWVVLGREGVCGFLVWRFLFVGSGGVVFRYCRMGGVLGDCGCCVCFFLVVWFGGILWCLCVGAGRGGCGGLCPLGRPLYSGSPTSYLPVCGAALFPLSEGWRGVWRFGMWGVFFCFSYILFWWWVFFVGWVGSPPAHPERFVCSLSPQYSLRYHPIEKESWRVPFQLLIFFAERSTPNAPIGGDPLFFIMQSF